MAGIHLWRHVATQALLVLIYLEQLSVVHYISSYCDYFLFMCFLLA